MKLANLARLLPIVALMLVLAGIPLKGQQQQTPDPASQAPSAQSQPQNPQQSQVFTGKVVKSKDGLVFQDDATSATYKVDNEDQLKQFAGKRVKITGTLDTATNMIRISNVELSQT